MVARRGFFGHVIYDEAMRRRCLLLLGALVFAGVSVASGAQAQSDEETTTTAKPTTTTSPPITFAPSTTVTTVKASPTTTTKGSTPTTASGAPKPPPASGASQTLDPSLLGGVGLIDLNPSTTTTIGGLFGTEDNITTTTFVTTNNAIDVASTHNGPSGAMLALATVAWLASIGGVLIYAEDQRGKQWRHLAR